MDWNSLHTSDDWALVQGFPQNAAAADSQQEGVGAFVMKNEITKMQETLRDKGYYRGKVDGVFGLRTRASIRAYQTSQESRVARCLRPQSCMKFTDSVP